MKIKGWDKINGFTYKGYCIVNPAYSVGSQGKYYADVLDLNTPQKTKWELTVLMPDFKFKQDNDITIILWDENKYRATKSISKDVIGHISGFRMVFENLVDEVLKLRLISAIRTPNSHSINSPAFKGTATVVNTGGGILNHVNNSGTNMIYANPNPISTITHGTIVDAIKELQKQIDDLKQNTPSNPF